MRKADDAKLCNSDNGERGKSMPRLAAKTVVLWLLANGVAGAVVGGISPFLPRLISILATPLAFGLCQWLVVRPHFAPGRWWFWMTAGGVFAFAPSSLALLGSPQAQTVLQEVAPEPARVLPLAVMGLIGGLVLGLVQWYSLSHYVRRAGWWLLASAAGGVPLGPTVGVLYLVIITGTSFGDPAAQALICALGGLGYALPTGITLAWLTADGDRPKHAFR